MYRATFTVLDANAAEYAGVAALGTQVGNFSNSIDLIGQLAQIQTADTSGIPIDKKMLQQQMVDMAMRVAGAVKAFASDTNNAALRQQADVNQSTFTRARDDLRDDVAQTMHDLGNTNIASLAPYGITAITLTGLQTRIDAYRAVIGAPRTARVGKSTATDMLAAEFARADTILQDRIDGLIEQFKDSGTTFYSDYKKARRIVDTGSQPPAPPTPPPPGP
ncbi:MAG: hypothetical protein DLM73_00185 [Chthoniobacterales bacterium]|nr:MAG: hypothetical protein DLM73_00185 [Chthoniobacterales bacterium]